MEWTIGKNNEGTLLRAFLRSAGISHRTLTALKQDDHGITVNGIRVTVRAILHEGDRVCLNVEEERSPSKVDPVSLPVTVLYEDDEICVVDKPSGMPTIPSHDHRNDTLANAMAYRALPAPYVFRPVNRLDKDTSGTVLCAKDRVAAARYGAMMRERRMEKCYLALLTGIPDPPCGRICRAIRRVPGSVMLREVCDEANGDRAETLYETLETHGGCALVRAHPLTGRTHQLRVHFASIGCPIVSDPLYGEELPVMPRLALHASALTLGDGRTFTAPLPEDFRAALRALGFSFGE